MSVPALLPLGVFLLTGGLVYLAARLLHSDERLEARLRGLAGADRPPTKAPVVDRARRAARKVAEPLLPSDQAQRTRLQARLIHAGCYHPQALSIYLAVKTLLILPPWAIGLTVGLLKLAPLHWSVAAGAVAGGLGLLLPSLWLDRRKAERQRLIRRGLPDVLDVLTLCLEGGLSSTAAFERVAGELRGADSVLGVELHIVRREMQLGRSLGEALGRFAQRCGLEEVARLASLVEQTERLGTGLAKALRQQTETLRFQRLQDAEERSQKAATKILFPALLCIFPGVFLVVLGPAALQMRDALTAVEHNRGRPAAEQWAAPRHGVLRPGGR
jgi:tight adherence protein C